LEGTPHAYGKTTRVPPALLGIVRGEVMVLEPRRIAARQAARRVALELSEQVGETVGYQVRFEEAVGPRTRLRFVTKDYVECAEVVGNTIKALKIYGDNLDGCETLIEFTDGTSFSSSVSAQPTIKGTLFRGGSPEIIRDTTYKKAHPCWLRHSKRHDAHPKCHWTSSPVSLSVAPS
jgi:hypothetical protein